MSQQKNSSFQQLQHNLYKFSPEDTEKKQALLKECSRIKIASAKLLKQYHNQLLFLLSYSQNRQEQSLAEAEMSRITANINSRLKEQLSGSGIFATPTRGAYSLSLIQWLLKNYTGTLSLHSFDDEGIHPRDVLARVLNDAEFELAADENLNAIKWIEKASGTKNKKQNLQWIINAFDLMDAANDIKDSLFESLSLYVEINPTEALFSRSFGKLNVPKHFFHSEGILKKFDEQELINRKLPTDKKLNDVEKQKIIDASRIAICLLNRETDPITYCREKKIKYFELERGLSIALFSIDSERNLPLESYVGFMMFKNGYPMSYGGAWLFGKRSLIGINIFEAFRGGESAYVFAQLLRCYRMAFGATYFEVEPYQFGKNNPEGIQSGAFWFYYRFGFRPINKRLFELSQNEIQKINQTKAYRTPANVLRDFTKSNLCAHFDASTTPPLNPTELSKFVTQKITKQFSGNRKLAFDYAIKKLRSEKIIGPKYNKQGLKKLALFFAFCFDFEKAKISDKKILSQLINFKIVSEFEYIHLLNKISFEKLASNELQTFLKTNKYPNLR